MLKNSLHLTVVNGSHMFCSAQPEHQDHVTPWESECRGWSLKLLGSLQAAARLSSMVLWRLKSDGQEWGGPWSYNMLAADEHN